MKARFISDSVGMFDVNRLDKLLRTSRSGIGGNAELILDPGGNICSEKGAFVQ